MELGKQFDIDILPCCPQVTSIFWTSCIGDNWQFYDEMFICEKILTTSTNKMYFQTID